MSKKVSRLTAPDRFQQFLAAADQLAAVKIIERGIGYNNDDDDYAREIEAIAEKFAGPYKRTSIDDVLTFEEHWAKMAAAHMVGLAIGLRLAGMKIGGAR